MDWQQMLDGVREGAFFQDLGKLNPEELADRLRWAALFTTDRLWAWLTQDSWWESAVHRGDSMVQPILAVLLERHLLNLETRFCPDRLFSYWGTVMKACRCNGKVAGLWRENETTLRSCCGEGELSLEAIVVQEKNFAQLLRKAEKALKTVPSELRWTADTVARLAARRSGGEEGYVPHRSYARVVIALKGNLADELRPGFLVDLELKDQGVGEPYILPERVFHATFRDAVSEVARDVGRRRFHRLELQPFSKAVSIPGEGEKGERSIELPNDYLEGRSGGLELLLSQLLANRARGHWWKHWYSLPPWVVGLGVLDPEAEGRTCPVGAVEAKIRILREDGIRVIVVADETAQRTKVANVLAKFSGRHGMSMVRAERVPKRTAETLIEASCAWETDIEKPPIVSRRGFIIASLAAGAGVGAGKYIFSHRRAQTLAMQRHKRKEMQVAARRIIDEYHKRPMSGAEGYLKEALKAEPVDAPPAQTSLNGLEVLKKSVHFDSIDWAQALSIEALKQAPIEPAYSTTIWELRKLDPKAAPTHIALESNTSGFGIIPVLISAVKPQIYYRTNKKMQESKEPGHLTLTTYRVYDISSFGNRGEPFFLEDYVIYFNGTQDQTCRGADYDWWGTRLPPSTQSAELSVELPTKRHFHNVKYVVRKEVDGKMIAVREIKEGDLLWPSAGTSSGTYYEGSTSVWIIPCDSINVDDFRWIYSIQWKWK